MTQTFPDLMKEAAAKFPNFCTAYAQFTMKGSYRVDARLQAMEIMQQFVGTVNYGIDPKGLLFYVEASDFSHVTADFKYYSWEGRNGFKIVQVDFTRDIDEHHIFARFIANVDPKYNIPLYNKAGGTGDWQNFRVAASQTFAFRQAGSNVFSLKLGPIRKQTYFTTSTTSAIADIPGTFMFPDVSKLTEEPLEGRKLLAEYTDDRIVFFLKPIRGDDPEKSLVYGIFLPTTLLNIGSSGAQGVETRWKPIRPTHYSAEGVEVEDEEN